MSGLFSIGLVFFALLVVGALALWRTSSEIRQRVRLWFVEVAEPVLKPSRVLSVPRFQKRVVVITLSQVVVTSSGRGVLGSPIVVHSSSDDFERLERAGVIDLVEDELGAELEEAAKKQGLTVPEPLVVELACDPTLIDGNPEITIGTPARGAVRRAAGPFARTTPLVRYVESQGVASHRGASTASHSMATSGSEAGTEARPATKSGGQKGGRAWLALTKPYPETSGFEEETCAYIEEELVSLDGEKAIWLEPGFTVKTIGRRNGADVCINHEGASRIHTELRREYSGRLVLVDMGSRNGTFVNSTRVTAKNLVNGDEIRFAPDGPRFVFSRLSAPEGIS